MIKINSSFHILLIVVFAIASVNITSYASEANLDRASQAYAKQDYSQAIEIYKSIEASEGVSASLLYNLGNAYAKSGDYGHAMVSYLNALKLDPSNKQLRNNIEFIASKVYDNNKAEIKNSKLSVDPDNDSFFTSVKRFLARDVASNTWAIWGLIFFILFLTSVSLYIFCENVLLRKIGFFSGLATLFLTIVMVLFSFYSANVVNADNEGVIIAHKVKLHSDPSIASKEMKVSLTRGTVMDVLDQYPSESANPQWYKVRLNSDFIGWVSSTDFLLAELD